MGQRSGYFFENGRFSIGKSTSITTKIIGTGSKIPRPEVIDWKVNAAKRKIILMAQSLDQCALESYEGEICAAEIGTGKHLARDSEWQWKIKHK